MRKNPDFSPKKRFDMTRTQRRLADHLQLLDQLTPPENEEQPFNPFGDSLPINEVEQVAGVHFTRKHDPQWAYNFGS